MGKKINPIIYRIGINKDWSHKWYANKKNYPNFIEEDFAIEKFVRGKLKGGAIRDVNVERQEGSIRIKIHSGRPGVIIGRGGAGVEELKKELLGLLMSIRTKRVRGKGKISKTTVTVDVLEVKNFEENAKLVAQTVAEQIEKRIPFRRVLKSTLDLVAKSRNVKGVKISVSGRLNGAEMCRREWVLKGGIPLHTLRSDIDFSKWNAYSSSYGIIGVKVWIYKGESFKKN